MKEKLSELSHGEMGVDDETLKVLDCITEDQLIRVGASWAHPIFLRDMAQPVIILRNY